MTRIAAAAPPQAAMLLADRYLLERELARGGMATVYRARDTKEDVPVAVKVLHPALLSGETARRFAREIRIAVELRHPNVVPVLDAGEVEVGGVPFYVMPLVDGESLAGRLARERPLPVGEALDVVTQVADALAAAHARGVVHRDVKPANILLSGRRALVADFGVARALDAAGGERLTETGRALGTVAYMAPEQAAGERVDARADVYALGCVLYELLAGTPPFVGATQAAVLARHALESPPRLRSARPEVTPALEALVRRALAKAPADRHPDAAALRDAIHDLTNENERCDSRS